jgi:hypothetical protein
MIRVTLSRGTHMVATGMCERPGGNCGFAGSGNCHLLAPSPSGWPPPRMEPPRASITCGAVTPSGMTRGGTRGFAAAGECRGLGVWCPAPGGALLPSRANRAQAQAAASPAESAGLSTRMASRTMRRGPGPECLTGLARPHPCVHQVNTVRYQAVASGHH